MKLILSILMLFFGLSAGAVTLPSLPEPPKATLPIDPGAPTIACNRILDELMKFKDMNRQHEDGVAAFLSQSVEKVGEWYQLLLPFEEQSKALEAGTLSTVQDGIEKMSQIVDYSYDNTALLAGELDRIIISLRECPFQVKTPPKR